MARKWSKSYANGYRAGKQGLRFPKAKWNRYSTGFKRGYARGKNGRSSYRRRYRRTRY
jgi:hypothetical protein